MKPEYFMEYQDFRKTSIHIPSKVCLRTFGDKVEWKEFIAKVEKNKRLILLRQWSENDNVSFKTELKSNFCKDNGMSLWLHFDNRKQKQLVEIEFNNELLEKREKVCQHGYIYVEVPNQPSILETLKEYINIDEKIEEHFYELEVDYNLLQERKNKWEKGNVESNFEIHPLLKHFNDLRPYQVCGYNIIRQLNSFGLFWEQRTGKTPTTIMGTIEQKKIIISVPSGHQYNWKGEYEQWTTRENVVVLTGTPKKRKEIYEKFNKAKDMVLIGSSTTIAKDVDLIVKGKIRQGIWKPKNFDTFILDEAHFLRNVNSLKSKGHFQLRKWSKYGIVLTGTPASRDASDVFGMLRFMRPDQNITKNLLNNFFFKGEKNFFSGWYDFKTIRANKEDLWVEFLATYTHTLKLKEVNKWVPDTLFETITIPMEKEQKKLFSEMVNDFRIITNDNKIKRVPNKLVQLIRLRQISLDQNVVDESAKTIGNKTKWLKEYLEDNNEKIIIWSTSTKYLKWLCEKHFPKALLFTGELSQQQKQEVSKKFQNSKSQIMFSNIQAGSIGWTWPCDVMIFLDRDWNPINNKQANYRGIAPTKAYAKKPLQIIDVHSERGTDVYVQQALEHKWNQTEIIDNIKVYLDEMGY